MAKDNKEMLAKVNQAQELAPPKTVANQVQDYLNKMLPEIKKVLPKHITPERIARVALTELRTNPILMECSLPSVLSCVMKSAQEGLEFGTGRAYMVPFWNGKKNQREAQYMRGYLGTLELCRRSGDVKFIDAGVVHEKDKFEFEKGFNTKCSISQNLQDRGEILGFYACCELANGARHAEFMSLAEILKIKERSKAKDFSPWQTDFAEMGKKTTLKRLMKVLPQSVEVAGFLKSEEEEEFTTRNDIEINLGEIEEPKKQLENGGTHKVVLESSMVSQELPLEYE